MATFTANSIATSINVGTRYTPATGQYDVTRGFVQMDISSLGLTAVDVSTVTLNAYISSMRGGTATYRLRSAIGAAGWGVALTADAADFDSTATNVEDDLSISATGWKSWNVNKNNLEYSGITYFRWSKDVGAATQDITLNSQNNSSNKPYLRIVEAGGGVHVIPVLFAGSPSGGGGTNDVNGPTSDGWVRATTTDPSEVSEA